MILRVFFLHENQVNARVCPGLQLVLVWSIPISGTYSHPTLGDRTGKPGVLQSMGSQRVRHELVTKQQQQTLIQTLLGAGHSG